MSKEGKAKEAPTRGGQEPDLLVEAIPELVWSAGPEGDIEYVNQRMLEYLGAPLGEVIGWGWMDKVHPDDVAFKKRTWLENLERGTPHDTVCRFRGADGRYRWFEVRGEPRRDSDGRVLSWIGVLIDTDDRRKAKEALRESEYKLRQIIDTIPALTRSTGSEGDQPGFMAQLQAILNVLPAYTWYAAPSGALTFVNKRTADYLGLPKDHLLRLGIDIGAQYDAHIGFLHPDDREESRKAWPVNMRTGEASEFSFRVRNAQGGYRWFLSRVEPLRASDGTLLQWVGVNLDIEERKRAEQALRESEAKFRDYAESASDWFWEIGPDYKFTMLTENAFGSNAADRIGAACWDRALDLETEPEKWRLLHAALGLRKPFRDFVYCCADGNGSPIYVKASGKPVFDGNGEFRGYRGSGADVTATIRAQEEHERLRQLESDLSHMNRLSVMGELAASLVHEVTQPIGSARNNARASLNFLGKESPDLGEVREALECVVGDADRARDIIDRIRAHIKKAVPLTERINLNEAISEVIGLARSAIAENGVSVQTQFGEGLGPIEGDRVQLQQVVLNLILNAIEAMRSIDGGARELLISTEQVGTSGVVVAVHDSGPGIDPEFRERVFEAFYTTKSSGVGMGLSICRTIIDSHGGRLWAEANAPLGAVFQFTLPSAEASSEISSRLIGSESRT